MREKGLTASMLWAGLLPGDLGGESVHDGAEAPLDRLFDH